jgi:hypothetical protein
MVTLDLMKAISAAFNSRDVERIVSFFAEDGIYAFKGDKIVHKNTFWKQVEHRDRL